MKYASKRAEGIDLIRQWAREHITAGAAPGDVHREFSGAFHVLLEEFRKEFDVPGATYWHHPESSSYFSTGPCELIDEQTATECIELTRPEFLGRQGIHFSYEDDVL